MISGKGDEGNKLNGMEARQGNEIILQEENRFRNGNLKQFVI